jgi:LuxR family transcriptional regulator of csgAB operon
MTPATSVKLSDACIHIIGPFHMQNQLLASFLKQETGAECRIWQRVDKIAGDGKGKAVILWDCKNMSAKAMIEEMASFPIADHRVLLFNVHSDVQFEQEAVHLGVCGFLYEQENYTILPKAIKAVLGGELWLSRAFMSRWIQSTKRNGRIPPNENGLTAKEAEILQLIARGASNKDIARQLFISSNTAKTHVYNIFKKINVANRLQAAIWARQHLP